MIREDQYAQILMEMKSLQRRLETAEKLATERWHLYDSERQNHNITKKDLRRAIDVLEYYLDNGDIHNTRTKAEDMVKSTVVLSDRPLPP